MTPPYGDWGTSYGLVAVNLAEGSHPVHYKLFPNLPIQDELGHGPSEHLHQLLVCALFFSVFSNGDHFFFYPVHFQLGVK